MSAASKLQWPISFAALDDPGDHSIPSLVKAVKSGSEVFVSQLVQEWQHATYFGIHGGFTPDPHKAREILDGLASASSQGAVLWHTAPDIERPYAGMMGEGARLEEHTTRELHAPLWWRVSAKAKVDYWQHRRDRMSVAGVQLLASEIMGLAFDQDREFRAHSAQLGSGGRVGLVFQELDFAITDEPPPELVRRAALDPNGPDDFPADKPPGEGRDLSAANFVADASLDRLLRDPTGNPSVVTTNLLGGYDPAVCRVVLYRPLAAWCAKAISADQRALENVVLLHETVHALCHLGLDLDGCRWDEFALPPSNYPTFRPSALHEGLAQYFTFRMLERLDDISMTDAFERLTAVQPPEYQQWRKMRSVSLEEAREVLLRARAGLTRSLAAITQRLTETDARRHGL